MTGCLSPCGNIECSLVGCIKAIKNPYKEHVKLDINERRHQKHEMQIVVLDQQIKDLTKRFEEFREQMFQVMVNSYNNRKEE